MAQLAKARAKQAVGAARSQMESAVTFDAMSDLKHLKIASQQGAEAGGGGGEGGFGGFGEAGGGGAGGGGGGGGGVQPGGGAAGRGGRGGAFEALAAGDAEEEGAFFGGFGDSLAGAAGGASSWLWGKATETAEAVRYLVITPSAVGQGDRVRRPASCSLLDLTPTPTLTLIPTLTLTQTPTLTPNTQAGAERRLLLRYG